MTASLRRVAHDEDYGRVLTKDERRTIGRALKALRISQDLGQKEVARRARVSVRTYQAIERNWYEVRPQNFERVLHYFGTTVRNLLAHSHGMPSPHDDGLNPEDRLVARLFHDAELDRRLRIKWVLNQQPGPIDEALKERLQRWAEQYLWKFTALDLDAIEQYMAAIAQRMPERDDTPKPHL